MIVGANAIARTNARKYRLHIRFSALCFLLGAAIFIGYIVIVRYGVLHYRMTSYHPQGAYTGLIITLVVITIVQLIAITAAIYYGFDHFKKAQLFKIQPARRSS